MPTLVSKPNAIRGRGFMPYHDGMRRLLTEGNVIDAQPRATSTTSTPSTKRRTFAANHASGPGTTGRISKIGHYQGKTVST